MKKYYCINCGKEINMNTALYKSGLCRSCVRKKIKINTKWDRILTKLFLIEEYIKNKRNINQIAKKIGCSIIPIRDRLKKFNIKIRTVSEAKMKEKIIVKCAICNKEIKLHPYRIKVSKNFYCSDKCLAKSRSIRFAKENHPNYIDGTGNFPYPIEFNDELKLKIRKRDNYMCQKCYTTEEEHLIVYGNVLSVHHIDYNKQNCDEDNLTTLCNECNIRVNFNRNYWKRYFIEKIRGGMKCQI